MRYFIIPLCLEMERFEKYVQAKPKLIAENIQSSRKHQLLRVWCRDVFNICSMSAYPLDQIKVILYGLLSSRMCLIVQSTTLF